MNPADFVQLVADRTGYLAELVAEHTHEADGRIENLAELATQASEFDDVSGFLETVALVADSDEIDSDGTRMSVAYGYTGRGRYLDEYLGPRLAPQVMPIYRQCVTRALPVYSIAHVDDARGRIVAYERLLLPFSEGKGVTQIIASLKTISEDGSFEITNLMRGNDALPTQKLCAVIDRELVHRMPGRIPSGDLIEFS